MSESIIPNPVGWFEIYVDKMPRAQAFYEAVFDQSLTSLLDPTEGSIQMYAFSSDMTQYGASGALVHTKEVSAGNNSTIVYFSCVDCAVEESRVVEAGGKVERAKMSLGEHGFCSMVIDTEGNMIGLHSQK